MDELQRTMEQLAKKGMGLEMENKELAKTNKVLVCVLLHGASKARRDVDQAAWVTIADLTSLDQIHPEIEPINMQSRHLDTHRPKLNGHRFDMRSSLRGGMGG
jgi:RNA:NAD 2'-phosphotransferase (TPT1/KptA family)